MSVLTGQLRRPPARPIAGWGNTWSLWDPQGGFEPHPRVVDPATMQRLDSLEPLRPPRHEALYPPVASETTTVVQAAGGEQPTPPPIPSAISMLGGVIHLEDVTGPPLGPSGLWYLLAEPGPDDRFRLVDVLVGAHGTAMNTYLWHESVGDPAFTGPCMKSIVVVLPGGGEDPWNEMYRVEEIWSGPFNGGPYIPDRGWDVIEPGDSLWVYSSAPSPPPTVMLRIWVTIARF